MNRTERTRIGQEAVQVSTRGWYEAPQGKRVSIAEVMQSAQRETVLYRPSDFDGMKDRLSELRRLGDAETKVSVSNTTTLRAAEGLVTRCPDEGICCLNFASAKNPGGGFLQGSGAQEESLARSSGLYQCLMQQRDYYTANRASRSPLYTDHMIFSPDVPVFRRDDGRLLYKPFRVSFLTAPAVNAKIALQQGIGEEHILAVMERRMERVLRVAALNRCSTLVLGAWGCGVFGNSPEDIARLFAEFLMAPGPFACIFRQIVFAVYDKTGSKEIIGPFLARFRTPCGRDMT